MVCQAGVRELWLIGYKPMSSTYRDSAGESPTVSADLNFFWSKRGESLQRADGPGTPYLREEGESV